MKKSHRLSVRLSGYQRYLLLRLRFHGYLTRGNTYSRNNLTNIHKFEIFLSEGGDSTLVYEEEVSVMKTSDYARE